MYEPRFARWLLELELRNDAIVISPDYRLVPEATGADVLNDVRSFWRWLQADLPGLAEARRWTRPDLVRILCCGESSGGLLSVYCALQLPTLLTSACSRLTCHACLTRAASRTWIRCASCTRWITSLTRS